MSEEKWGEIVKNYIYNNWKRYLDDCQIPTDTSLINPNDLLDLLNSINEKIQFTMELSKENVPFLDILIKRNENLIWMDLYHKPTDTRRCVEFSSCHPNHCKRNIPFSLARRVHVICENEKEKAIHLRELNENLQKQGYPKNLITNAFTKAAHIPTEELRKPKAKENDKNVLSFISTHNPNNPDIFFKNKCRSKNTD